MAKNISQKYLVFPRMMKFVTPRDRLALKQKSAIPTIFPNCPSYITSTKEQTQRFSRDDKEKTTVQTAINLRLVVNTFTIAKFSITILNDIVCKLNCIVLSSGWVFHKPKPDTFPPKITTLPCIQCSLVIDKGLLTCALAFDQQNRQIYLSINKIDDIRQIEILLIKIETFCLSNPNSKLINKSWSCFRKSCVENSIVESGPAPSGVSRVFGHPLPQLLSNRFYTFCLLWVSQPVNSPSGHPLPLRPGAGYVNWNVPLN